ncbi:THO complex subunit 4A-like [Brassica napus]|uniref:THO complex subunit 4A-like n=1 Tax=Brassica napus TaxID=3708 RepID=UPI0020788882|nr:THO complex subunit 4A-like [Brassica napus]
MSLDDMIAKIKVVFSRRGDATAAVKKYNDVQLDGKPMKIEIVGNNLQTASATTGRPGTGSKNFSVGDQIYTLVIIGGQGRGGQQRGTGGRGKGPAEKISAEDLDADLDKYHAADMETN